MKKQIKKNLNLLAIGLFLFSITGCASEMERDADKMAESALEMVRLIKRAEDRSNLNGKPVTQQEVDSKSREHTILFNKMWEKYGSSPEEWEEFTSLVNEKLEEAE